MTTVRIGHSPDADDAFMFYALTAGKVKIPGVTIEHVLEDIESLNRRSRTAELEVTAVSFATYLLIADRYRMMDPGSSMGKGYGPILVARGPVPRAELENRVVAIPGKHTTSALLLSLYVGDPPLIEVAFDKIPQAVLDGQADLGSTDSRRPDYPPDDGADEGSRPGRRMATGHRSAAAARCQRDAPGHG